MSAPISQRLRCLFSGHDWRTAIGPRDGFFRRCRRCYATAPIEESEVPTPVVGEDSPRSEAAAEPEGIEASSNGLAEERPAPDAQPAADEGEPSSAPQAEGGDGKPHARASSE